MASTATDGLTILFNVASYATDGKQDGDGEDLKGWSHLPPNQSGAKTVASFATDGPAQYKMERMGIRGNLKCGVNI